MTDRMNRTELMYACVDQNVNLVKNLLKEGANVNLQDKSGWTALHFASQECNYEIIKLLLEHSAVVDIEDSYGNTPLWRALFNVRDDDERGKAVKLLLRHGADKYKKNKSGISPYDLAQDSSNYDLMQYLDDHKKYKSC